MHKEVSRSGPVNLNNFAQGYKGWREPEVGKVSGRIQFLP